MIEILEGNDTGPADPAAPPVPLEWLETQLCELAGHLTAATYRFLVLLADFDARQGWAEWDLPSCAAWLSWKCQLTAGTAREHVRVARALPHLPVIAAEFAAGRMSFAKVRALTRIATPLTEAGLAELAGPMTASQLERFTAAHRRVTKADDENAALIRRLTWRQHEDGTLGITIRLPPADGAVVLQALRAATGDLEHPHGEGDMPDSGSQVKATAASLADALIHIAGTYLEDKAATAANPDIYHVIVHVGPEALATPPAADVSAETRPVEHPARPGRCHIDDGPAISPLTAQMIACQATVSWMLHDHDGTLLDVGRRHRKPSPALRRAVRERDRCRCQFPGCNSRRTDIHHIIPWARGGTTKLKNLILLCRFHHTIVHATGYNITLADSGPRFATSSGLAVPVSPSLPGGEDDLAGVHGAEIDPETIIPAWYGDKLNLDLAIWACFANARVAEERAAQTVPAEAA